MMRITVVLFLFISLVANAQKLDFTHFNGMKMRSLGPAGMSGRVTAIDAVTDQPNEIVIGTASGGVWKSNNAGLTWNPLFDQQPVMGIGSVTIQQSNPDVIWVGTGEGNPRNSHTCGAGIFKSIDGGRTWKNMGLKNTKTIHRIIINRDNPAIVYAGCVGSPWGPNKERGVYKTTDGGKTWKQILFVNDLTGCADLVVDPSNPNKLFAAMWEHQREPWFFNSGGKGSGLYVTHDGGENWKRISEQQGLPKGDLGRIGLAIAPSNPNTVYALIESQEMAFYRSVNGGVSWKKMATKNVGNRPFYYADIFVDPQNENRIFSLHSLITKSEDGGKNFEIIIPYTGVGVHPDHHAFWINPKNPKHILEGNDGGLNVSYDGAKTWRFIENIPVAQFYHINIDDDFPYRIYGGMQDNGSYVGPSQVMKNGGITNFEWQEVLFGDGFDVLPDLTNNRFGYAMYQKGNLYYYDLETGQSQYIQPTHPKGEKLRFNWNAALAQDPHNKKGVYFGSQFVHYTTNKGKDWKILSPDLTTNDSTKQRQSESGGLSIDATGAENHTTILCIAPDAINQEVLWVGTDDGNLQLTKNGGKTWINLSDQLIGPKKGCWIPQIEVSKHQEGEAFVVVNDYRRNDFSTYLYHTTNFGQTFKRIATDEQVNGYALSIVQDPVVPELLFLGTENGLYISIDKGQNWTQWTKDYPSVSTMDLKIQEREADLVIGTFGRAIYILDDIRPLRELAKTKGKWIEENFTVLDGGTAYRLYRNAATGVRFRADGYFVGDNQSSHAQLKVWIKETGEPSKKKQEESGDSEKKKSKRNAKELSQTIPEKKDSINSQDETDWEKITVHVRQLQDTLFTFKQKADTGLQVVNWYLNQKGVHYPTRKKLKKIEKDPFGPAVLPGNYELILVYGTYKDSTTIEVKADPRVKYEAEGEKSKTALRKAFYKVVDKARNGFELTIDLKENVNRVNSYFKAAEDSVKKKVHQWGKEITDSLSTIQNMYMQDPKLKGYQDNSQKLNTFLFNASELIESAMGASGSNAQQAFDKAKNRTNELVDQINDFLNTEWKKYQEKVQKEQSNLFRKHAPVGK